MHSDSAMPVKTVPTNFGSNPVEVTKPEHALGCIDRVMAIIQAPDNSPYSRAMLSRVVVNEFSDVTAYCFRKLEISPWGDEERAELAAAMAAEERKKGA